MRWTILVEIVVAVGVVCCALVAVLGTWRTRWSLATRASAVLAVALVPLVLGVLASVAIGASTDHMLTVLPLGGSADDAIRASADVQAVACVHAGALATLVAGVLGVASTLFRAQAVAQAWRG